jgi:hypothetical protein
MKFTMDEGIENKITFLDINIPRPKQTYLIYTDT